MIFETHGHYDDEQFDTDRERLLEEFQRQDIRYVMNIGANIVTSKASVELAHRYDFIYAGIGTHPDDAPELSDAAIEMYRQMAADEKVKAIGEIGLDYYWDKEPEVQNAQRYWFRRQMELARETNLPVIIHSRDAAADTMEVMKEVHAEEIPGVIHCYSYSKEMALEYKITSRKTASILDTFSCVFQGILPYGAQMLVAISAVNELGYEMSAFQILPVLFYPMMLLISSLIWIFIIPADR